MKLTICRVFLSYYICILLLFDQLRSFVDCNEFMKCNSRQIILLHLPYAAGKFLKIAQLKPGELSFPQYTSVFVALW